ncbi:MAG: MotA/TolQ/ExbB proton channel family protein [Acidithiobacillus sp.]
MDMHALFTIAQESGGILFIMPIILLLVLWVSFERFLFINRMVQQGERIAAALDSAPDLRPGTLAPIAEHSPYPFRALLEVPLRFPQIRDSARLSEVLQEMVMRQVPSLDKRLWILDTAVTLAPLLGLLGTIIGMFHAFHVLAAPGHAPTEVTGGVADALVATASGLFIAILGLLAFNGFNNQVRQILLQLDSVKTMLINRMDGQPMLNPEGDQNIETAELPRMARVG